MTGGGQGMMLQPSPAHHAVWVIAALAAAGVIVRPFKSPEAAWACGGAGLLVGAGLLPLDQAARAVGQGLDVYLFLAGMMLLSETARRAGLFDWIAAAAVHRAKGSPRRLFLLVYAVGTVVTALLSNDAAAVVLTPAVYAAARRARLQPLPFLFICAFVANAASFVLPISNPANLVLYGDHPLPLGRWIASFALPSALSILATYLALRWTEGRALPAAFEGEVDIPALSPGGWTALAGLAATAAALVTASVLGLQLGAPTCAMGVLTTAVVLLRQGEGPGDTLKGISWGVLPLVGGLFVLVQALSSTGLTGALAAALSHAERLSPTATPWALGGLIALVSNLINNLPAGLIASSAVLADHPATRTVDALLIGVDLGPNLSVTGSLATLLWLAALRREGEAVGVWRFLRTGALVTPPALILALAGRLLLPG